jgi:hypothetical protein
MVSAMEMMPLTQLSWTITGPSLSDEVMVDRIAPACRDRKLPEWGKSKNLVSEE